MRAGVCVVGFLATVVAIKVDSIYGLFYLCSDLVYVILFPQLVTVMYMKHSNLYGAISGYIMGFLFRLTGGEPLLGFAPAIYYPMWYEKDGVIFQNFPFKTLSMLVALFFIVMVSLLTRELFRKGILPRNADVLNCVVDTLDDSDIIKLSQVEKKLENIIYTNKDKELGKLEKGTKNGYVTMSPANGTLSV